MNKNVIYVDNSATTPIINSVYLAMEPFIQKKYGNSSSIYEIGRESNSILNNCRISIAKDLVAHEPSEIIFTSGGSESNNLAIKGLINYNIRNKIFKNHIITSKIEHPAILNTLKYLKQLYNVDITYLNVDKYGIIDINELINSFNENTKLVTIMYANNEIGSIQPIKEIVKIAHKKNVLVHTDAVQAIGHININLKDLDIDFLSLSGHKFHGPKGIGCLYLKKHTKIDPLIHGGNQESGYRSGTEAISLIVGLTSALNYCVNNLESRTKYIKKMSDYLIKNILNKIPQSYLVGHPINRLENIVNFCFDAIEGEALLLLLDSFGICASTGSACSSKSLKTSHVLRAVDNQKLNLHGSLRISLSHLNTEQEIKFIIEKLIVSVNKLRILSPLWN